MSDLVEFLRARLDEREREVRERHSRTCGHDAVDADAACACDDHISFSLAEVDAKRRLVYDCAEYLAEMRELAEILDCAAGDEEGAGLPMRALKYLALPYADHHGYREEWRP